MDIEKIRSEFPILRRTIYKHPLVYLDNTATSQTPNRVVESVVNSYTKTKSNVHRGVRTLSMEATELQESARRKVREFINAASIEEVIFTRGTTESINLVAASYGGAFLQDGDEIILSTMEHHSNIVPWQLLQRTKDIKIRVIPINADGELDLNAYRSLFNEHTRFASVCHASNVLGTINPIKEIIAEAHAHNVPVLIDGAQAAPHLKMDVQDPLGAMPPYQGGGEMIESVSFEKTTFAELPFKFEAGTPDFIGIAALHQAIDFIESLGIAQIAAHEHELLEYTTRRMLEEIPDMRIFGTAPDKCAIISFLVGNEHHYDMGMLLDKLGIAVRTGHHCAQPLMNALGVEGTVRASFAVYNTIEECDMFLTALHRVAEMLR